MRRRAWIGLSRALIGNPELGVGSARQLAASANPGWVFWLDKLVDEGLASDHATRGVEWAPFAELFTQTFVGKCRALRGDKRDGDPYRPLVFDEVDNIFRSARPDDVTRQAKPDALLPFDFCEACVWLERKEPGRGHEFFDRCTGMVKSLFPTACRSSRHRGPPVTAADVVPVLARAFRMGAREADKHWNALWTGTSHADIPKIERGIEGAMRHTICGELKWLAEEWPAAHFAGRKPSIPFTWISRGSPALQGEGDLVFIVEGLGGRRNLESRLPLFSLSIAAALRDPDSGDLLPLCAGVYLPSMRHLYVGVSGEGGDFAGGGAVLIDQRLGEVHKLTGSGSRPGGRLTVGIHHSRALTDRSREFANRVSPILPEYVDKELAIGAGAWSLALTAAGSLAAYFEVTIACCSAYAGAVILCAACQKDTAATTLDCETAWLKGSPHTRTSETSGILAWSDADLQAAIKDQVKDICDTLP